MSSTPSPSPSPPPITSPLPPFSLYREIRIDVGASLAPGHLLRKRARPLYTYNFSPPSTPRGNHTIPTKVEQTDAYDFTPRCSFQRLIGIQQEAVIKSVTVSDEQWAQAAQMLSPLPCNRKPPRPNCPHPPLDCRICPFIPPCLCITCAGFKAKPKITPCIVCGALIPYSICDKKQPTATLPTLCFECKCMFVN